MNPNRNRRRRNNYNTKPKKIIRCKTLNRPVYEHEVCSQFNAKIKSNNEKNCENCVYSF